MSENWREKEFEQEIIKFDPNKEIQVLIMKFLNDGIGKNFKNQVFDKNLKKYIYVDAFSVEFQVEFNGQKLKFSSGSTRLRKVLISLAKDLTGKRVKITKHGIGMNTTYEAEILKE